MYLFLQSELLFQWCSLAQGYTAYFLMTAFIVIYHLENKQIIIIINWFQVFKLFKGLRVQGFQCSNCSRINRFKGYMT